VTEIGCHPGYPDDLDSSYTAEREQELRTLTDSRVRARIEELAIELIGFHEVRRSRLGTRRRTRNADSASSGASSGTARDHGWSRC